MGMKKRNKSTQCGNCNWTFKDANNYCPNCGQENHHFHAPLKEILHEFMESLFHFDAKVWLTLKTMVVSPGLISKHFFENKRQRYVLPFRFYIFISVIYFFLLNVIPEKKTASAKTNDNGFTVGKITISADEKKKLAVFNETQIDSFLVAKGNADKLSRILFKKMIRMELDESENDKISGSFNKTLSYSMFLLMPLFAFILLGFYKNKNRYYSSFLTVSIHTHTAIFVLMIIDVFLSYFIQSDLISFIQILAIFTYLYFSFRTYFGKEKLLVKTIFISLIYLFFIIVVMALNAIVALWFI